MLRAYELGREQREPRDVGRMDQCWIELVGRGQDQKPADLGKGSLRGSEGNRVVNWMGVVKQRIREFSPRNRSRIAASRSRRILWCSLRVQAKTTAVRKPLPILAKTKEPRDLSAAGFFVNWSVAQFRDQMYSSPVATHFIKFLCFLHEGLHRRSNSQDLTARPKHPEFDPQRLEGWTPPTTNFLEWPVDETRL